MTPAQERRHRLTLAYVRLFLDIHGKLSPDGRLVLADLKRLSRKNDGGLVVSPVSRTVDIYATMHANGRREVFDRITTMIGLDDFDDKPQEMSDATRSTDTAT